MLTKEELAKLKKFDLKYMKKTPKTERPHVGIFGRRNVGKSSFMNALTGQDIAIVSEKPGTTTDPVFKPVEFLGVGPIVLVDTAGIDDDEEDRDKIGEKRKESALKVISKVDMAILLISNNTFGNYERMLIKLFNEYKVPFVVIHNKEDIEPLHEEVKKQLEQNFGIEVFSFSSIKYNEEKRDDLVYKIAKYIPPSSFKPLGVFENLVKPYDIILLITPIDSEAPEGRLILPQVKAVRDLLDRNAISIVLQHTEIKPFFEKYDLTKTPIKFAVTDSQAFDYVKNVLPKEVPLTSFSILFARINGDFYEYIKGIERIKDLKDGDRILIMESCTHNVSDEDIGRVKIPRWLRQKTGKDLSFDVVSGFNDPPMAYENYALAIQCGGCMFTRRQVLGRLKPLIDRGIPITNYGMVIAYANGMFEDAVRVILDLESKN